MYVLCFNGGEYLLARLTDMDRGCVSVSHADRYTPPGPYPSAQLTRYGTGGAYLSATLNQIRTPRSISVSRADRYGPPRDISDGGMDLSLHRHNAVRCNGEAIRMHQDAMRRPCELVGSHEELV